MSIILSLIIWVLVMAALFTSGHWVLGVIVLLIGLCN